MVKAPKAGPSPDPSGCRGVPRGDDAAGAVAQLAPGGKLLSGSASRKPWHGGTHSAAVVGEGVVGEGKREWLSFTEL